MVSRQQYIDAFNELIKRGWSAEEAHAELKTAITHSGNYMMHDKDGNPVIDFSSKGISEPDEESEESWWETLKRVQDSFNDDKEEGEFELSRFDQNSDIDTIEFKDELKGEEKELELSEDGLKEKGELWEPDKAPPWTLVRGSGASFYHICPRCGAMIPGTGPNLIGPDGKERTPKEQHEDWHKSRLIDWYNEDE